MRFEMASRSCWAIASHDVERQLVGFGHIAGDELDPAFHQLGDNEDGFLPAAQGESFEKLWTVAALAAFDFLKRLDDFTASARGVGGHGRGLGFEAQSGAALLVGRNAEVSDETGAIEQGNAPLYQILTPL